MVAQENSIDFPARVRPRLPGGSIHKIRVTADDIKVLTWPGLYDNKDSKCVLVIPHSSIRNSEYVAPMLMAGEGRCIVRYLDESGEERKLRFNAVDQSALSGNIYAQSRQNEYTENVAHAINELGQGMVFLPSLPSLTLKPPSTTKKLFFGIGIVFGGGMAAASLAANSIFIGFFGAFVLCMSLAALGIDYVRIHTGWHPILKVVAYIGIFLVAFVLFAAAITLLEVLNAI
jgi:hypothetical protein